VTRVQQNMPNTLYYYIFKLHIVYSP